MSYEEADRARRSRIYNVRSNLTEKESSRVREVEHSLELALARQFGNRLDDLIISDLLSEIVLDADILAYATAGIEIGLPKDAAAWNQFARDQVERHRFAKLNLEFSDEKRRAELKAQFVDEMRPERRMELARSGQLDAHLKQDVDEALQREAGL